MAPRGVVALPHPLVDASGAGWVATESTAPVVGLTSGREALLVDATRAGTRVVLVTAADARITVPLYQALRSLAGAWVVRAADGLRHGVGGALLARVEDALAHPLDDPAEIARAASAPDDDLVSAVREQQAPPVPWLQWNVVVHHAARAEALLGATTEALVAPLADPTTTVWGTAEPESVAWDRPRLTALARARSPRDTRLLVAGGGQEAVAWSGTVRVARSDTGIVEETRLVAALPGRGGEVDAERASSALVRLAGRQQVLFATAWSSVGAADATITPFRPTAPEPVAAVVGARAVRSLPVDAVRFADEQGGVLVGPPRTPSLVVAFGADETRWRRFGEALGALGADAVRDALVPEGVRRAP